MLQAHNFIGKTALVMGASRGIGEATAQTLAAYGASVALVARDKTSLIELVEKIRAQGGNAERYACDVSDYEQVQACIKAVMATFRQIDFLVNNAGVIEPQAKLLESDAEQWARAIDINVKGVYHCIRAAVPLMLKNDGGGAVVNLSSGAATKAIVGWSHYCASKAAVKKLTETLHQELEGTRVYVVGLSPGTVATDMMRQIKDANINAVSQLDWSAHIPPEWPAEAIAFLCGEEGREFAGTDFSIKTDEGRKRVGLPT